MGNSLVFSRWRDPFEGSMLSGHTNWCNVVLENGGECDCHYDKLEPCPTCGEIGCCGFLGLDPIMCMPEKEGE
jgi:hypothetical protein